MFWTDVALTDIFYDKDIEYADVFESRDMARRDKECGEVVLKVSLTPEGRAIKVIGRG